MFSITILTTLHSEGFVANATLRNIEMCRDRARSHGACNVTSILLLDRATAPTKVTASDFAASRDWVKVVHTDYGDPGLARNHGMTHVTSDFVGVWDGDDLLTANWIFASINHLLSSDYNVICVPQYIVTFDKEHIFLEQPKSISIPRVKLGMLTSNYWGSWLITRSEILASVTYKPVYPVSSTGIGSEDWHWNCEQLHKGRSFWPVQSTAVFYRRRQGTRLSIDQSYFQTYPIKIASTKLFSPIQQRGDE